MMEFEHFLNRCLGDRRGGVCLEIGTFNGISAVVMSQYFDRVICTSVDDTPEALIKHDVMKYLGIENVRFFDCRNNYEKRMLVRQLDGFDFCYMDGNHREDTHS